MSEATQKLREKILDLAFRGKMSIQLQSDTPVSKFLENNEIHKQNCLKEKHIKKQDIKQDFLVTWDNEPILTYRDGRKTQCPENKFLFNIPISWALVSLGTLFQHNTGKTLNSKSKGEFEVEYITTSNVYWNGPNLNTVKKALFTKNELDKFIATKGDLLVCEGGDCGRAMIWEEDFDIHYQNHIHRLRPYVNSLNIKFYYYVIYYLKLTGNLKAKGIGMENLSASDLHSIIVPLPPIEEQKRIVDKIEELFVQIDEIERQEAELAKNVELAKEKVLDLAYSGILYNSTKDSSNIITYDNIDFSITGIEKIPSNWNWATVKDVSTYNPKNKLEDSADVSFVPMPLVEAGYGNKYSCENKKWKDVKKGFTHFSEGDVAIAKITPCFQNRKSTIFFDLPNGYGAGTTELHILRPNDRVDNRYLYYYLTRQKFIDYGVMNFTGAVGQQRVGKNILLDYPIPVPSLNIQTEIVNRISSTFKLLDNIHY